MRIRDEGSGYHFWILIRMVMVLGIFLAATAPVLAVEPEGLPQIDEQPVDVRVLEGLTAAFSVTASGADLTYQWQRKGVDLEAATDRTYTISSVALSDDGAAFRCIVSNTDGSVSSEPAVLTIHARGDLDYDGDTDRDDVNIITSYRNQPADACPECDIDEDGTITVLDARQAVLLCFCANCLCPTEGPVITDHPVDVSVTAGDTATFAVTANGEDLSYQWQINGEDISDANGSVFTIPTAALSDDGTTYRCVVSNAGGRIQSDAATLYVKSGTQIIITQQPVDLTVTEGEAAEFTVAATGVGLSYQWQKGGIDIAGAQDATFTISAATPADAGNYRCVVSNAGGSVESDEATLTVNLAPPVITSQPESLSVNEGDPATFSVVATGTQLSYQWQKGGIDIAGAQDATFTISAATLADAGNYRCVVSNSGGSVESDETSLTVNLAPLEIIAHPQSQIVTEGDPATFSVTASGNQLSYQWQKNGEDIAGATEATFNIPATVLTDQANYRCKVSDPTPTEIFSNEASLTVNMNVPPNAVPVTNVQATWEQGHASLTWDIVENVKYRIYRGTDSADTPFLIDTDHPPYLDISTQYFKTYYYRLATIKEYTHPVTGEVAQAGGPLTEAVILQALPTPRISVNGAVQQAAGIFTLLCGPTPPYMVSGTYENMTGAVVVTAAQAGTTVTSSGADRTFTIELTTAGQWQISAAEQDGWLTASLQLQLEPDDQAPELTVVGPAVRETAADFIMISGTAEDKKSGLDTVEVTSDRYDDTIFSVIMETSGAFSGEIPLGVNVNLLTVTATDRVGNQTDKTIQVTLQPPVLPSLIITSPANGTTLYQEKIDLTGVVRSSLEPDQIRLVFGNQVQFPTGSDGEYAFVFKDVLLDPGPNTLEVRAETIHGNVAAQTTVAYLLEEPEEEKVPPTIEIHSPRRDAFISASGVEVSGIAGSEPGIQSVMVNGQSAQLIGSGGSVSFSSELTFSGAPEEDLEIIVTAVDNLALSTTVSFHVRRDSLPPVIDLTASGLLPAPEVNAVLEAPFQLTGSVADTYLAGLSINDQTVGVLPGEPAGTYTFDAGVALIRGEDSLLTIEAWDLAGNRTSREVILRLEADLNIEVLSPRQNAEILASGDTVDIDVSVRVAGMASDDEVRIQIDPHDPQTLNRAGDLARGSIAVAATEGGHQLNVAVTNAAGEVIATRMVAFSIVNTDNIALALERLEPDNGADNIEPNAFIAMYFNKPINPDLLQVQVQETVHGKIYQETEPGADLTRQSVVKLVDVHRDQEPVSGGMAWFPGDTMAAFYPERDFAYTATVYVTVSYDGSELARTNFTIRPLPTLIQGFAADQFMQPIEGIVVEILEVGRTAITDNGGSYGFGYGEAADQMIPAGRYRAVVNPGLKNRSFGTVEMLIRVIEGRVNSVGLTKLPILNSQEPFRSITGGLEQVLLAGDELTLDLSDAALAFPDGRNQGEVHAQFMNLNEIPYPALPSAVPHWVFGVQPMGIEVTGNVELEFVMPTLYGSHDYITEIGERVILVGFDPNSLQLVPVGVGLVDADNKRVTSEIPVQLQRLDYLGYALVDENKQPILEKVSKGEIDVQLMIGELETKE